MSQSMNVCLAMSAPNCPLLAVAPAHRPGWTMSAGVSTRVLSCGYRGLNSKNHFTQPEARR